jgi:hypothetical protein
MMHGTSVSAEAAPGYIELLSPEFVRGWAQFHEGVPAHVCALIDGRVVGTAIADETRGDLGDVGLQAGGFLIVFERRFSFEERVRVQVRVVGSGAELPRSAGMSWGREPVRQVFVLGSPRSGTSEMGATLTRVLDLPWQGEFHAAPLFAQAAAALRGDPEAPDELHRFLAHRHLPEHLSRLARFTYYGVHGLASFVDKTPGVEMIGAAPFLAQCFPDAKFIYLRRNGISNVLSRLAKFGGDFNEHCADWAAALTKWEEVRGVLPGFLELRQEDMLAAPDKVAAQLAAYLEVPELEPAFAASLAEGRLERTGAGVGKFLLSQTGWDGAQIDIFRHLCGPVMKRFGYPM